MVINTKEHSDKRPAKQGAEEVIGRVRLSRGKPSSGSIAPHQKQGMPSLPHNSGCSKAVNLIPATTGITERIDKLSREEEVNI